MSSLDDALAEMIRDVVREVVHDEAAQIVAQLREALARNAGLERRVLSIDEAASRYAVSDSTIRRRIRTGELDHRKIGTRTVVPVDALEATFGPVNGTGPERADVPGPDREHRDARQ